jgi:hypothetical protein
MAEKITIMANEKCRIEQAAACRYLQLPEGVNDAFEN